MLSIIEHQASVAMIAFQNDGCGLWLKLVDNNTVKSDTNTE